MIGHAIHKLDAFDGCVCYSHVLFKVQKCKNTHTHKTFNCTYNTEQEHRTRTYLSKYVFNTMGGNGIIVFTAYNEYVKNDNLNLVFYLGKFVS